jgi:hypothetical protein
MKIRWENERLTFIPESRAQIKQLAQYFKHITAGAGGDEVGFGVLDVNRDVHRFLSFTPSPRRASRRLESVKVFFENSRLVFEPVSEGDKRDLADWWAQLQTIEKDGQVPTISSTTAEKALILFVPQR